MYDVGVGLVTCPTVSATFSLRVGGGGGRGPSICIFIMRRHAPVYSLFAKIQNALLLVWRWPKWGGVHATFRGAILEASAVGGDRHFLANRVLRHDALSCGVEPRLIVDTIPVVRANLRLDLCLALRCGRRAADLAVRPFFGVRVYGYIYTASDESQCWVTLRWGCWTSCSPMKERVHGEKKKWLRGRNWHSL